MSDPTTTGLLDHRRRRSSSSASSASSPTARRRRRSRRRHKAQELTQKLEAAGLRMPDDPNIFVRTLGDDGGVVCDNPTQVVRQGAAVRPADQRRRLRRPPPGHHRPRHPARRGDDPRHLLPRPARALPGRHQRPQDRRHHRPLMPEPDRPAARGVLLAACVSALVVNANTSAVTILLPAISKDVDAPVDQLQWAVTGYSLVGAAVIVTSGALGDVFGRRKVFLGGLALFIASCALIALSTSAAGVIGGRMIQGASGATILACGMSLLSVAASGAGQLKAITLLGGRVRGGWRARPAARRRARRHHGLAGPVLDRRGDRGRLHPADAAQRRGVARSGQAALDRLRRHRPGRADAGARDPRAQRGQRLGLGVGGHARLPRGRARGRRRLRLGRAAGHGAARRPPPAAQPRARRRHAGDPHRRGHDQRADVRPEPVLPEPRGARAERLRGGAGRRCPRPPP